MYINPKEDIKDFQSTHLVCDSVYNKRIKNKNVSRETFHKKSSKKNIKICKITT